MGLIGGWRWICCGSRKQCRSVFWRVKAAVKKKKRRNQSKKQFKFQYDACSYALNFDDGGGDDRLGDFRRDKMRVFCRHPESPDCSKSAGAGAGGVTTTWVYVILL